MTDLKKRDLQLDVMVSFFHSYQAFTARPDEILARRGLSRVHHRILFFIARQPGLSISELLGHLGVSKQALNIPLRQLLEMHLVLSQTDATDKRKRLLTLTEEGIKLESALRREQVKLLQRTFDQAGSDSVAGWLEVNRLLAQQRPA